jgi:hypothetical protein
MLSPANLINVVFQRREWENIIKDIESAIKKINGPHAGTDWKDKQHFLAEAAKDFRYFKNAWRNYAMRFHRNRYEPRLQ